MSHELKHYGTLESEKIAEENLHARQIVHEIGNFGINDRQRWLIMYLLGLELENVEDMKAVSQWISDRLVGRGLFVGTPEQEDGE